VTVLGWLVLAYLVGGFPTSLLAGKIAGVDLREHGSKNLGATNVYRVLGWKYAIPVGLLDMAKGAIPVWLFAPRAGDSIWLPLAMGAAAIAGHVFSPFTRFRGGKGVATAAGAVLGLAPLPFLGSLLLWVAVLWATGYVSLASMTAAVAFPLLTKLFLPQAWLTFFAGLVIAGFIVFTHRSNIRRLLDGTESRFGRRKRTA